MISVRRLAMASALCVVSLLVSVNPAGAVGNGVDPTVTAIREPVSGQLVDDWKLAGRASASGVQVAPQWVLTTRHAPGAVGGKFTNAYGTATIDAVTSCATSSCDLSLSHLTAPLSAPAYPDLLDNGLPRLDGTVAGSALVVGMGGGKLTAGWTTPTGIPELSTLGAPPTAISGDSGGPAFYHRPGDPTGHLFGLMTYASPGVISGVPQFNADAKAFITGVAGTAVRWTTFDQLGPKQVRPEAITDFTATATATTIRLNWNAVTAAPPVTAYTAVLVNPDNAADRKVVRTTGTTAAFTVATGVKWAAFVLPESVNGQALVPAGMNSSGTVVTYIYSRYVAAAAAPANAVHDVVVTATPDGLRVEWERGAGAVADVNHTEVRLCRGSDIQCVAPFYRVDTENPAVDITIPDVAYADHFMLSLTDRNLVGAAYPVTTVATYLPLRAPLPARSVSAHLTDTTLTFGLDPRGDDPITMFPLGRYRQHATPDIYMVSFLDLQGRKRSLPTVDVATRPALDVVLASARLTPGRYDFTFTPYNWIWGQGTPITLSVPVGTPGDYSVAAKVPPTPVITGANPITWTQPTPTATQAPVEGYLLAEQVSGQVYEVGPDTRAFDLGSLHLQSTQRWQVIAVNYDSGQSLPATGPEVDVPIQD
ncbi:hypothetical protein [Actinokineospora inagensis]|uniref:hypothetical protein n=1 Tax=Actinokineospora inagensis TaxID=103730 RepID=UPI00047AEFA4|nr:hypothetical protein [Actinokineospora inagensis]